MTPFCHSGSTKPKLSQNLVVSSLELSGRVAVVGYSEVLIGFISLVSNSFPIFLACSITKLAYLYHDVCPLAAKWYNPANSGLRIDCHNELC